MLQPLFHSLEIAFLATLIGSLITFPSSYFGAYISYKGKALVEILLLLPLVLPPTIVGFYLLKLFGNYGPLGKFLNLFHYSVIFQLSGAILATTIVTLPLLYQGFLGAFKNMPLGLREVAQTLGANPFEVFVKVILPYSWPSVLASILLAFCRGLGEFGASLMVAGYIEGKTDTLASSIYFSLQGGNNQQANLLSLVNVLIGLVLLMVIRLLSKKGGGAK